jgi:hypothetical protein
MSAGPETLFASLALSSVVQIMASLIVEQVSERSARIWVHGREKTGTALLRHRVKGSKEWLGTCGAPLLDHLGHAAVFELEDLDPATTYECELSCKTTGASATGSFTTAPDRPRDRGGVTGQFPLEAGALSGVIRPR